MISSELTEEHIVTIPVTELRVGDEFWGDTVDGPGSGMFYRLAEGPLPPRTRPNWIVWRVTWMDGGDSFRQWTPRRQLTVRRAHD